MRAVFNATENSGVIGQLDNTRVCTQRTRCGVDLTIPHSEWLQGKMLPDKDKSNPNWDDDTTPEITHDDTDDAGLGQPQP